MPIDTKLTNINVNLGKYAILFVQNPQKHHVFLFGVRIVFRTPLLYNKQYHKLYIRRSVVKKRYTTPMASLLAFSERDIILASDELTDGGIDNELGNDPL